MNANNINKLIKYLVYGLIVYTLFEYVPQKKLPSSDIFIMISIIIISFIILDILTPTNYYNNSHNQVIENLDVPVLFNDDKIENEDNDDDNDDDIDDSDYDNKYINLIKPQIIKDFEDKKILTNNETDEIINLCSNKNNCFNKIKELLNNKKINNDQFIELRIAFGLDKLSDLQELYLQERLTKEQAFNIAIIIDSDSKQFIKAILQKYVHENIINQQDSNKIYNNLELKEDDNIGRSYLANMIKDNLLIPINAKLIDDKCSSSSMDSCAIQLNKFLKDKNINTVQAVAILKGYNKPGLNNLMHDNSYYGSISNDSELKGIETNADYGDINANDMLLEDEELLKQSKSIVTPPNSDNIENNLQNIDSQNINSQNIDLKKMLKFASDVITDETNENDKYSYNYTNDMKYSIYTDEQHNPLGKYNKDFNNNFINGNSYLATDKWKVPEYDNPTCKLEENCNTCEEDYEGYPVDVSKWDYTRKILPRDNININYIQDKLN